MEQLAAIVAVCRLAILKRMPATPLTLLVAHRQREQVKAQDQRSGKMKTLGSLSEESSPETDFIPELREETSKYGRKRTRCARDNYVSF